MSINRVLLKLVLLVVIPVLVVSWLGWRLHDNQRMVAQSRFDQWVDTELKAHDDLLQTYFAALEQSWLSLRGHLPDSVQGLRELARKDPLISQVFVMDAQGKRLYPVSDPLLSQREAAFIKRSATIWDSKEFLYATRKQTEQARLGATSGQASVGRLPLFRSVRESNFSKLANEGFTSGYDTQNFGWYVWHWSTQRRTAFWWREADGRIVGLELSPVRVMSDLIGLLPETADSDKGQSHLIQLFGPSGNVLYQWGDYGPAPGEAKRNTWPTSFPLHGWYFAYFSAAPGSGGVLALLLGIVAIAIALIVLAINLYREQQRSTRLAQQRVSFVSQVSHELKTPLTNIRLYAELLAESLNRQLPSRSTDDSFDKLKRYSQIISDESQRLSRMIRNVLSFSRDQSRRLEVHSVAGDLSELIESVVASFRPAFNQQGLRLELDMDLPESVLFDADATEQILGNLLSNVERYAINSEQQSPMVRIQATINKASGRACVTVQDNGPGIAVAWQEKIFDPFVRISNKLTDGVAGTGIGLSIARQLAELQGGSLVLLASSDNEAAIGACFELSLPLVRPE